jgi:transcription elongation factor Elf1
MLWLEEKYINMLSNRLPLFRRVKPLQYVFRCPICGDSKKHQTKTRGGFYVPPSAQEYNMGCFNCGASMKFGNFLKMTDPTLYDEYVVEKFKEKSASPIARKHTTYVEPKTKRFSLDGIECVTTLGSDHPVIGYLEKRKIPLDAYSKLFYAPSFRKFSSSLEIEGGQRNFKKDHPRLIIPFFDKRGNVSRLTARSFSPTENPKYLYIKIDPNGSRLFGLDNVDSSKTVYVVEGPLDSLFLPNSIAIGSADFCAKDIDVFSNKIIVPDNEPRNPNVCEAINKAIKKGHRVCLWNEWWGKDIDDMVVGGKTPEQVLDMIQSSTVSGIEAELKFLKWRR